jgi:hypothetical protein
MYLSCEKLEVLNHKLPDGRTSQEMRAYRKVLIEGEEFSGIADVVKYDESKDQIILEGTQGNLAVLYRERAKGMEREKISAMQITYWRSTGAAHIEGGREIKMSR